jgi:hypothetical protein
VRLWHLLLIVPFVGTLWVPFYDRIEPRLGGVPYFYWYQFLWIGIGALLTAIVYFATRVPEEKAHRSAGGEGEGGGGDARDPERGR